MFKKILYIGSKYDYAISKKKKSLNYFAWYKSFKKLKYNTKGIFYEDFADSLSLQNKIISFSLLFKPDLIFFILRKSEIKISTLLNLKKNNFFTINFFGDDNWRFDNFSSNYSKYFSAVITDSIFNIKKHNELGQRNVIYSNWASLDILKKKKNIKYIYDVSFIGQCNGYRKWLINELLKNKIKVNCFGPGWDNNYISYEKMSKIISQTKVNLNIPNSLSYDIRYILSSIKNFLSFIKNIINCEPKNFHEIKARNFEICFSGGFQITNYIPFLEKSFTIGKEIVCYQGLNDLIQLINYYLHNDKDREKIKTNGEKKALMYHSYEKRIQFIMKSLNKIKYKDLN